MSHWRTFLDVEARGGRYLPWKEVARATGLSRTTAWRLQKRDEFPAPYAISPGRVGYREDEVEAWRVSRELRGGRVTPAPAEIVSPPRSAPTSRKAVPRRDTTPAAVAADRALADPSPTAAPPADTPKTRRRRSEHARAIAQQIMFDF